MSDKLKRKKVVKYKYTYMEHTTNGHNKFYEMRELLNKKNEFVARYGRIGSTGTEKIYPMSKYWEISQQKQNKGYRVIEDGLRETEISDDIEITEKFKQILFKINKLIDISNSALTLNSGIDAYTLEKHQEILKIKEKATQASLSREDMEFLNERYKMLSELLG